MAKSRKQRIDKFILDVKGRIDHQMLDLVFFQTYRCIAWQDSGLRFFTDDAIRQDLREKGEER